MSKGWRKEPARHSLSARGVKTQPHKSARRHRMTIEEAEEQEQFKRDFEDTDLIESRYDLSDPDSDASIDRAAREEMQAEGEHEFWSGAASAYKEGPKVFESWLQENCVPEFQDEVRKHLKHNEEVERLVEKGWTWSVVQQKMIPPKSITKKEAKKLLQRIADGKYTGKKVVR